MALMEHPILRAITWGVRWIGLSTVFTLLLVAALIGNLIFGLANVTEGIQANLLLPFGLIALILSWLLARSSWPDWPAILAGLFGGVVLLFLQIGKLYDEILRTCWQVLVWGGQFLDWLWNRATWFLDKPQSNFPNAEGLAAEVDGLVSGVQVMAGRLVGWVQRLVNGHPSFDPVSTALFWGLIFWIVIFWLAWMLRRYERPFLAVLPLLSLQAAVFAYAGADFSQLSYALALIFLLIAYVRFDLRQRQWDRFKIDYAQAIRFDVIFTSVVLIAILVLAASLAPSLSIKKIVDAFREMANERIQEEEFTESLGLEPAYVPEQRDVFDDRRRGGMPSSHLLGGSLELSEEVFFVVSVREPRDWLVGFNPFDQEEIPRYYWRGLTYDIYNGHGWQTGQTQRREYQAGEQIVSPEQENYQLLRQEVHVMNDETNLLYVAGELVTADLDYRVAWRSNPELPNAVDAFGATIQGDTYRVDSLVPVYSVQALQVAGEAYPQWVSARYLALPEGIPQRVYNLAYELTATAATPFDRAAAIEAYLRTNYPYTLEVPLPPSDQDVVDYFLFDLQEGYCDYYATSMVVLARAAGVPARMVSGFVSGGYDVQNDRFVVTQSLAHSWVEVYFPGYGWVEFEPTAGRRGIPRPGSLTTTAYMLEDEPLEDITLHRTRTNWAITGISIVVAYLLFFWLYQLWSFADRWRLRRLTPEMAVVNIYQRLYRHARHLKILPKMGATPLEFADALEDRLEALKARMPRIKGLGEAEEQIDWLTDMYTRAIYSEKGSDKAEQKEAIRTWWQLRRRMWLARIVNRFAR
ncbi:MAG: hypothetical protein JXB38_03400 [Anaerolineales bacterium]|nr:hypothetical protein [Anaerolineales bacterium]